MNQAFEFTENPYQPYNVYGNRDIKISRMDNKISEMDG